jgi:hypothetical protein
LAGIVTVLPVHARADGAEDDARKSFELGNKLYAEGALREALAAFELSYKTLPRASSLQNVAQCHRDLKEFDKAWRAYDELVRTFSASLNPDKLEAARTALAELGKVTGAVSFAVKEPGVRVDVDGADVGETPLGPLRLAVGAHALTATKAGFRTLHKTFEIHGGDDVSVDGPLERDVPTGHVAVVAPSGARVPVTLDGVAIGLLPWEGDLPPGRHRFDAGGVAPVVVEVEAGRQSVVTIDVRPDASVPATALAAEDTGQAALRRTLGFVGLGFGAAGLVVGGVTGGMVLAKHGQLQNECPTGTCYGTARDDLSGYHTLGTASTVGFVAGGALLATGVVLLATAPSRRTGGARVVPALGRRAGFISLEASFQ